GRHIVIAAVVALSLFASWTLLAYLGALDPLLRHKGGNAAPVAVQSFNSNSPSKEYVYAGSKLIATVEPTAVNGKDAKFVSMLYQEPCATDWLPVGPNSFGTPTSPQPYKVRITMMNTGSVQWTTGSYYLGSQNPL